MNLELEILKKDVIFLKKEIAILKEHILHQESRNYFKVQWTFEQQKSLDIITWLTFFKKQYTCNTIYYTYNQDEDTHFQSSLFPDLKNYKIQLIIYFSTSVKQLPSQIQSNFTGYIQVDSYITQKEFDENRSKESYLKIFE